MAVSFACSTPSMVILEVESTKTAGRNMKMTARRRRPRAIPK
jgi:hypothetical protein